jgi:hypothetical protein
MISNPESTTLISSQGWVDHDALWRFDVPTATIDRVPLGTGARYLSLHTTGSGRFSVGHHFDGARFQLTVHGFADPRAILAGAVIEGEGGRLTGEAAAWTGVPLLYVAYLAAAPWKDFVILKVSPATGEIRAQRLPWYGEAYDKDYQGIVDVLALPGEDAALVSVQRSSRLVVHDLGTGRQTGSVDLGDRGGNPTLRLRGAGDEIWASDYDTLVVIRPRDRRVVRRARVQGAAGGTQQFIGEFAFAPDEDLCVVARPFSGDVVGLDAATLGIRHTAKVGRQPLEVAALPGREVVARDWKTGELLRGRLERRVSWLRGLLYGVRHPGA